MLCKDWIIGFIEGEGSFTVEISKTKHSLGYYPIPKFQLVQHEKDKHVLDDICEFFGFGKVKPISNQRLREQGIKASDQYMFHVHSQACYQLKEFFEKNPLQSSKKEAFEVWAKILDLIKAGKHKRKEGLLEIARLRDRMNLRRAQKHPKYRDYAFFLKEFKKHGQLKL